MTIFTVKFDVDKTGSWAKLLNVFVRSVRENAPDAKVIVHEIPKPQHHRGKAVNLTYNTAKLQCWSDYMQKAKDKTIFIDCDMLCLKNPASVFQYVFDIAITTGGQGAKPPLNAGVIFVNPTYRAREFFKQWVIINNNMYSDAVFHGLWKSKYLGINQAALGCMIETGLCDDILKLPQNIYNLTDKLWGEIDIKSIFVHIKSELRNHALQGLPPHGKYTTALKLWYKYAALTGINTTPDKKIMGKTLNTKAHKARTRVKK